MKDRTDIYAYVAERVAAFLRDGGYRDTSISVALSGGADSVCLLYVLADLRETLALRLSAIHVHHGIRGEEAEEDLRFCSALCETLGIPLEVYRVDVPAHAEKWHFSLESAARDLRYAMFEMYHSQHRDTLIATAHHADDNAETVLFRMARGTGLRGMCGIPARRQFYIRPCLSLRREEMRAALAARGLSYREDSTNADTVYTRNYIRHEVMPVLENVHEGAVRNISLMTESLAEDEAYLMQLAMDRFSHADPRRMRAAIAAEPDVIAKRMLMYLYDTVRRSSDAMTAEQMREALRLIKSDKVHARMTLPSGVELYIERDTFMFREADGGIRLARHDVGLGLNLFPETGECLVLSKEPIDLSKFPSLNIYKLLIHCTLCFDTMDVHLHVRAKEDGDAYRYGGMTHTLKKLFNDKKLSLRDRAVRPVLCDDTGIVWVPGFGISETRNNEGEHRIYACYCGFSESI